MKVFIVNAKARMEARKCFTHKKFFSADELLFLYQVQLSLFLRTFERDGLLICIVF